MGTHEEEDMKSIFCSQLLGGALKKMNIIPQHVVSSNFLPSHFDEKEITPDSDPLDALLQPKLSKSIIFQQVGPELKKQKSATSTVDNSFSIKSCRITGTTNSEDSKGSSYTVSKFDID